jgi:hypothetical protein
MKFILSACILLLSITASAKFQDPVPISPKDTSSLQIYPLNADFRYERDKSQNSGLHNYSNIAFAYQLRAVSFLVEYAKYTEGSGNATTNIDHTHQELSLWARWHFARTDKSKSGIQLSLYGGLGVGGYQDEVTTTLMSVSQTDKSGTRVLSGVSLGADATWDIANGFGVVGAVEGRSLFGADFDPNPTIGGVVRLGLLYSF